MSVGPLRLKTNTSLNLLQNICTTTCYLGYDEDFEAISTRGTTALPLMCRLEDLRVPVPSWYG